MSKFCDLDKNIKHIGEVSTSRADGSPTGAKILTSTNEVTGQERDTLAGKFKQMDDAFNSITSSQFIVANFGNWSDVAGQQITDSDRIKGYEYPDNSGNLYAIRGNVTLPITRPATPIGDDRFYLSGSVNVEKMRSESASHMGLVYSGEWSSGIVIPSGSTTNKLVYWHNGQFYRVGTNTSFTSNDFDSDLSADRFVSAETSNPLNSHLLSAGWFSYKTISVWIEGYTASVGEYFAYNGAVWEVNNDNTVLPISPNYNIAHWCREANVIYPDQFGGFAEVGVNQTPAIQRMEDFGLLINAPTYYHADIYELHTQVVQLRAPQMHGAGGGNGSLRSKKSVSTRDLVGTVFWSKVVGDYAIKTNPAIYDFGGRIDDITLVGHVDYSAPKTVGHGWFMHNLGWSAQSNNLTIMGFKGKLLTIKYMQDTVFNSLTLLDGSNGQAEPCLEFDGSSNFIYFNNPHFEESPNFITVKSGSVAPWEVHFNNGHFETGNYFDGEAASSPDPSLERRYATSPIYSNEKMRLWKFNECMFVPCGVRALVADNGGSIDAQPYFIQFNDANGCELNNCTAQAPTSAIDLLFIASDPDSVYGKNKVSKLKVIQANATRYAIKTDNTDITDVDYSFESSLSSSRLYGIEADNCYVDNVSYIALLENATRTEGALLSSLLKGKTRVGTISYNLKSPPFNYLSKGIVVQNDGYNEYEIPRGGTIDLAKYPSDAQFIKTIDGAVTIDNITNANIGRKLYITNASTGNITITTAGGITPGESIGQDSAAVYFAASDNRLRPM